MDFHFFIIIDRDELKLLKADFVVFLVNVGLASIDLVLRSKTLHQICINLCFLLEVTHNQCFRLIPLSDIGKVFKVVLVSSKYLVL